MIDHDTARWSESEQGRPSLPSVPPPRAGGGGEAEQQESPSRAAIRVLPPAVSARIAAGEVIERPASVVKELLENAIDAGARRVRVDIRGAGLTMIRVGDDGHGIRAAELWLACQRHATSKLAAADGHRLSGVRTLGFRGEALPSIAAVAELSVVSAPDERGVGWRLTLRDGQVIADEPAPHPRGTTVTVRHLFAGVPARLAAAGRSQTETGQIAQTVRHAALAAPGVGCSFLVDERLIFQTSGSGDLRTTLVELHGPALTGALLPLGSVESAEAVIWGVISGPEVTRASRAQVNVVVNGRWSLPRGLIAQIEAAYRPLLPRGRHPVLALAIETAPDRVDVNIHPSKLEVRLLAERAIGAAAAEMIREVLGRHPLPLQLEAASGLAALRFLPPAPPGIAEPAERYDAGPIVTPGLPPLVLIGQVQARLLLLEGDDGLYLVDQHRAHERILYERLRSDRSPPPPVEPELALLPDPIVLELQPSQVAGFSRRLDELAALGFVCEIFGGRTFLVRRTPDLPGVGTEASDDRLRGLGNPDAMVEVLRALAAEDTIEAAEGEDWQERLLVRLSCRTAVRRGRPLDHPAMRALVEGLGQTAAPAVCPHGSPLLMRVGADLLERQFGWH